MASMPTPPASGDQGVFAVSPALAAFRWFVAHFVKRVLYAMAKTAMPTLNVEGQVYAYPQGGKIVPIVSFASAPPPPGSRPDL